MNGRVAIVTGGGTGIGAAVVRRLAGQGVRCVINYASSRNDAEALAADVANDSIAVQADVADETEIRIAVAHDLVGAARVLSIDLRAAGGGERVGGDHDARIFSDDHNG